MENTEKKSKPTLYLLPNMLSEERNHSVYLPSSVDQLVSTLDGLIAESEQGGRRFLSLFPTKKLTHLMPIALLNEHTLDTDLDFLLEPIKKGERWALVSDSGVPCIADPGSKLVNRARKTGIVIQAIVGPSSILMALMLSGFSGQRFTFHGYLNKEPAERQKQIRQLEKSAREGFTQIFIEAPYRNTHTLNSLIETLSDSTQLCIAWDLTLPTQGILSQAVAVWKKSPLPNLEKKPAVFLIAN